MSTTGQSCIAPLRRRMAAVCDKWLAPRNRFRVGPSRELSSSHAREVPMRTTTVAFAAICGAISIAARGQTGGGVRIHESPAVSHGRYYGLSRPLRSIPPRQGGAEAVERDLPVGHSNRPPSVPGFVDPVRQDWTAGYAYGSTLAP